MFTLVAVILLSGAPAALAQTGQPPPAEPPPQEERTLEDVFTAILQLILEFLEWWFDGLMNPSPDPMMPDPATPDPALPDPLPPDPLPFGLVCPG